MRITKSTYIGSYVSYKSCPKPSMPEYAFIGRSNVGKSSLINMLVDHKSLAKTSSTPGKTQTINIFNINEAFFLADLPGYGWARVSKASKEKWEKMIKEYLKKRENLSCVMVLVDSRLEPQKLDISFINWLGENGIPFVIVFTKCDKQSKTKTGTMIAAFKKRLLQDWETLPSLFTTSSTEKVGKEDVLKFIEQTNHEYYKAIG